MGPLTLSLNPDMETLWGNTPGRWAQFRAFSILILLGKSRNVRAVICDPLRYLTTLREKFDISARSCADRHIGYARSLLAVYRLPSFNRNHWYW